MTTMKEMRAKAEKGVFDNPKMPFVAYTEAATKAEAKELMPDWVGEVIETSLGFCGFLSADDYHELGVIAAKARKSLV